MMYTAKLTMNPMEQDNVTVKPTSVTQRRGFIDYKDVKHRSRLISHNKQSNAILKNASVNYLKLIETINPSFKSDQVFIPRRTLTNPREPSKNHGHDNINDDYILKVNDVLVGDKARYEILDLMGQGTFGQVVKCRAMKTGELVAIKVIKRQPAFLMQGDKEINILMMLRDRRERHRFLQLKDFFHYRGHTCVVFELLSISLHGLFSQQVKRPHLSIGDIQKISFNILETLALLKEMHIIHTDLKPDNILMKSLDDIHDVKLIDYGSALLESEKLNYCVQTAFYRSPEVILHVEFGCAIDMWSFGCFVAEMFLGRPLFPSGNEATLLHMMVSTLGCLPPDSMLKRGKNSNKFFHVHQSNNGAAVTTQTKLREINHNTHDILVGKTTLRDKIMGFSSNDDNDDDDDDDDSIIDNFQEMEKKEQLYDFLKRILVFEPQVRCTPEEALRHPFITSAMGNISRNSSNNENSTPQQNQSAITTSSSLTVSPVVIYESLVNAVVNNNSSSINTSRTTEDSPELKTPPVLSPHYNNRSKDSLPLKPSKSPKIVITSPQSTASPPAAIKKPPLKSILKKTNPDIIKKTNPDNTLDSRIASIYHQPRSESTLSNTSNPYDTTQQYMQHLYNTVTTTAPSQQHFAALASPILQNYHQQQQQQKQQQQQLVNNILQHMNQQQQQTYISPLIYQQQQQQQHYSVQQQQQQPAYPNRHFSPLQNLH